MHRIFYIISDIISITVLLQSLILKVPQILIIYQKKSAKGLSLKAMLLELASYSTSLMYNYTNKHALLTYIEYPILVIQDYIMVALIIKYSNLPMKYFIYVMSVYVSLSLGFAKSLLDKRILTYLIPFTTPISAFSKILMLIAIIRARNADAVSLLTWFLSITTNAARIYTIALDSGDFYLLTNFIVSTILSTSVYLTASYYKNYKSK